MSASQTQGRKVLYASRKSGDEFEAEIHLYWEVHADPISDDYCDIDNPMDIWQAWRRRYPRDERAEALFGEGAFRIWWYMASSDGQFETSPGSKVPGGATDGWLAHFTWPRDPDSGEQVSIMGLPVIDKLWRPGNAEKGGFIQEVTGWKPAPLQEFVNVPHLERWSAL